MGLCIAEGLVKLSWKEFWNYTLTYPRNAQNSLSNTGGEMYYGSRQLCSMAAWGELFSLELRHRFVCFWKKMWEGDERHTTVPDLEGLSSFRAQGINILYCSVLFSQLFYSCIIGRSGIRSRRFFGSLYHLYRIMPLSNYYGQMEVKILQLQSKPDKTITFEVYISLTWEGKLLRCGKYK